MAQFEGHPTPSQISISDCRCAQSKPDGPDCQPLARSRNQALPGGIAVVSAGGKDTIYVANVFAYRSVDGTTGGVSEVSRMHADGGTLDYPMSATAKGDVVVLSSWITGTVQLVDRNTGKTLEMLHDFKAPYDAIRLDDGSLLVNELGAKSLTKVSGEHGKDRSTIIGDLAGPVGLAEGPNGSVYLTEAFGGLVARIDLASGTRTVVAKDLKMPEGLAVTPAGKLVVAEVGAKRLVEIDPRTGTISEIASNLPIGLVAAPGLPPTDIPTGVAVGGSGTIYFSSDIENAIYRVTAK